MNVNKCIDAFLKCGKLLSIAVPVSVTTIGAFSFKGRKSLQSVKFDASTLRSSKIGRHAFADCSALESIDIPQSVDNVESKSFGHYEKLQRVTLQSSSTTFEHDAFHNYPALSIKEEMIRKFATGHLIASLLSSIYDANREATPLKGKKDRCEKSLEVNAFANGHWRR